MNSDYLKIYLDSTLRLAKTLVIKSQDAVEGINEQIRIMYGQSWVDEFDPTSWKYYQNICGQYHKTQMVNGRPAITVTSLDTLETIEFTKEALAQHVATKKAYQFGSRYYYNLLMSYPEYEQLILGVLYPADMEKAIAADPGTILAYPTDLVEPQELSLIRELESWLKNYLARWHVRAFAVTDSLYPAAHHAIMYLNVVPKILNLRLRKCKTEEAHTFHIRQYLASHGNLDKYMDYMTLKQQLFLYRNILYIEKKAGHKETFEWLIRWLLTDRSIPLAEFSARSKTLFDDQFYPGLWFRRKAMNLPINGPEREVFNLEELLDKEQNNAYYNEMYSSNHLKRINFAFQTSKSAITQTKVLDSVVFDYTNAAVYSRVDLLIQHWAALSAQGKYRVSVSFRDSVAGLSRNMLCADAFVYYMYAMMRSFGMAPTTIPSFRYNRVLRTDTVTLEDLESVCDKRFSDRKQKAQEILNTRPLVSSKVSIDSFFNMVENVYKFSTQQWRDVSQTENMYRRAEVQAMYTMLYADGWVTFESSLIKNGSSTSPMSYSKWLASQGLASEDYTEDQWLQLATDIFMAATGLLVNDKLLMVNVQKAMIAIMKQLSSYSVQFLSNTNDTPLKFINWPAVRLGDVENTVDTGSFFPVAGLVQETHNTESRRVETQSLDVQIVGEPELGETSRYYFKNDISITSNDVSDTIFNYPTLRVGARTVRSPEVQESTDKYGYAGSPDYKSLNDSEKLSLFDAYGTNRVFKALSL